MVSRVFWGDWKNPQMRIEPIPLDKAQIENIKNMSGQSRPNINGERCEWVHDGMLRVSCDSTKSAVMSFIKSGFLCFVTGVSFSVFEATVWKYTDKFPSPYFKIVPRVILTVTLIFTLCRTWGAYCHIFKEIVPKVKAVANERTEFYQNKQLSTLTTQVLHPREAEYWAQACDLQFAEWLTVPPKDIDAFLTPPPFKIPNTISQKILDRSVTASEIVESYDKFAQSLKIKRQAFSEEIKNYEQNALHIVNENVPKITEATRSLMDGLSDEKTALYRHYYELACWHLLPQMFQEAISRIKNGEASLDIDKQCYTEVRIFKNRVAAFHRGEELSVEVPDLSDIRPGLPPFSLLEKSFVGFKIDTWKESALKDKPTKGTSQEYWIFIRMLAKKMV